jgi:hypothetical protein
VWGAEYLAWNGANFVTPSNANAAFAELYGSGNRYYAQSEAVRAYRTLRQHSSIPVGPMLNIAAANFNSAQDFANLLRQLCTEQGRVTYVGLYAGNGGYWDNATAKYNAINASLNACTAGTFG